MIAKSFLTIFFSFQYCLAFNLQMRTQRQYPTMIRSLFMTSQNKANVNIYESLDRVSNELCNHFVRLAKSEINNKGKFYVAVPGGSALKLLKFLKDRKSELDWSKVVLFYVNHKCVPDDDDSATHFKARNIFLDDVGHVKTYVPDASKANPIERASSYETVLKSTVPLKNGLPYFDLVVLGFGKDGHIGSLYPGRNEVNNVSSLVVSVDKKSPSSVSLTLPVFNNAKEILVIATGADKAEASSWAINKTKDKQDFPVCGVRAEGTTYMIDTAASTLL